jgi:hypothetical protein
MQFSSPLPLLVHEQVFWGVDRPLGQAGEDSAGRLRVVEVADGAPWYVSHPDRRLPPGFVHELVDEVCQRSIPGLSLAGCRRLDDASLGPLARAAHLERLDLFHVPVGDAAVVHLAGLERLTTLHLAATEITDRAAEVIASLPRLRALHLGWTTIGGGALERLARAPSLRELDLRETRVSDADLHHLARFPALVGLGLEGTAVSDAGVRQLRPLADRLERLHLGYTGLTDGSALDLMGFRRLQTLGLRATRVGRDHDARFREAAPGLAPRASQDGPAGLVR